MKRTRRAGAIKYGQAKLDISDEMDVDGDRARYEADRAKDLRLAGAHGLDEVIQTERLDAVLFPGGSGAAMAARPGYPTVIVPFALVPNTSSVPFPAGFDAKPQPYGVSFTGLACSEGGCLRSRLPSSRRPDGACRRLAPRDRADHSTRNGGAGVAMPGSVTIIGVPTDCTKPGVGRQAPAPASSVGDETVSIELTAVS